MAEVYKCIKSCNINESVESLAIGCIKSCIFSLTRCDLEDFQGVRESERPRVFLSIAFAIALVPVTALFAGLTIGLLGLDVVSLNILEHAGEPKEREYAKKILPIRKQGNLLLCTLLLGNTVINSAISILIADLTTGAIGLLVSTFLILIFGEIIPQSICTRHGLYVGARSVWIVKICMALLSPIVWPTSIVLDWMLGRDIGNVYSREELKRLIDIHVMDPDAQAESGLTHADQRLIIGALDYKNKRVKDVMTSLEQCFMLEKSLRLTFQTMLAIYKSGFTRVPVFEGDRQNIVAVMYAKDLILVDPDDSIQVGTVLSFRGRNVAHVSQEAPLDEVLRIFMNSNNHMLIAHAAPSTSYDGADISATAVTGLITLEDVMETLMQQEIVDETDIFEDVNTGLRRGGPRVDVANFLAMFEHKLNHLQVLSPAEREAVFAFLTRNVEELRALAPFEIPLKGLISHAEVIERELSSPAEHTGEHNPSPGTSWGQGNSLSSRFSRSALSEAQQVTLYERGVPSDTFTLILQGKVLIRTGAEGFELECGPWNCLGNKALVQDSYVPDFDAVGVAPLRVLRIRRAAFLACLEATSLQPVVNYQRTRGPAGGLSTVFEIAGPDAAGSPPLGGPPSATQASDFNAAEYLQRKSAINPRPKAPDASGRAEALDHRIHQTEQPDSDSELQFEDRPLLETEDRPI